MRIEAAAFVTALCCAAGAGADAAQRPPERLPALPQSGASAEAFVPPGWTLETVARGDLDSDGRPDLAIVLLAPDLPSTRPRPGPYDTDPTAYANPRLLAVAMARPQGGYRLVVRSHAFLPPKWAPNGLSQGWMLFEDGSLSVSRGRLRVIFQYTRGHSSFTFRWQSGALRLIGFDRSGVEAGCLHAVSVNFLTGRARLLAQNIDEERGRALWRELGRRPLLSVDQVGDGEEFDPDRLSTGFPLRCRGQQ